jgi:hypothetical protein
MTAGRTMAVVRVVYHQVEMALWAALTAFVLWFAVFVAPKLPALQAAAERSRIEQIAHEDETYCAKWHMGPESAMHSQCVADLEALRAQIEDQRAAELLL